MPSDYDPDLYQTDNSRLLVSQLKRELTNVKKVLDDLTDRVEALESDS